MLGPTRLWPFPPGPGGTAAAIREVRAAIDAFVGPLARSRPLVAEHHATHLERIADAWLIGGSDPGDEWLAAHLAALPPSARDSAEAALADLCAWLRSRGW
jgi:hypothetical protein